MVPRLLTSAPKNDLSAICMALLADLARSEDESFVSNSSLGKKLVRWSVKGFNAASKDIRLQSLRFSDHVLRAFQGLAGTDFIEDSILEMLEDRLVSIRVLACRMVQHLPASSKIAQALVGATEDLNADVRCEALQSLGSVGGWKKLTSVVAERCRDVDPKVRKQAYVTLNSGGHVSRIEAELLRTIVLAGVRDGDDSVRLAASVWLIGTLLPHFGNDPERTVRKLTKEREEQDQLIESLVKSGLKLQLEYFKQRIDDLSPVSARLWIAYALELTPEAREAILPSLDVFCTILEHYQNDPGQFVPLSGLLACYDMSFYEAKRGELNDTLRNILRQGDQILPEIRTASQEALKLLSDDPLLYTQMILEVISDLVDEGEFVAAVEMTQGLLTDPRLTLMGTPGLLDVLDSVLLPSVSSESPAVRAASIRALGCYCLLSLDMTERFLLLFVTMIDRDLPSVAVEALNVLFDFCVIFGAALAPRLHDVVRTDLANGPQCPDEVHPILARILAPLEDVNSAPELYEIACVGLAKLLLHDRLHSPKQLGRAVAIAAQGVPVMQLFAQTYSRTNTVVSLPRLRRGLRFSVRRIRGLTQGHQLRSLASQWNVPWDSLATDGLENGGDVMALRQLCSSGGRASEVLKHAMLNRAQSERSPEALNSLVEWAEARKVDLPLPGERLSSRKKKAKTMTAKKSGSSRKTTAAVSSVSAKKRGRMIESEGDSWGEQPANGGDDDNEEAPEVEREEFVTPSTIQIRKQKKKRGAETDERSIPSEVEQWNAANADVDDFQLPTESSRTPIVRRPQLNPAMKREPIGSRLGRGPSRRPMEVIDLVEEDSGMARLAAENRLLKQQLAAMEGKRPRVADESMSFATPGKRMKESEDTSVQRERYFIMCSGLSLSKKQGVFEAVRNLNGDYTEQNAFSTRVTHVVSSGIKSSKTLAGALCGTFIVRPEWVTESTQSSRFVDELSHGVKYERSESPVYQRLIHMTPEFEAASKSRSDGINMALPAVSGLIYSLGCARRCDRMDQAEIVLTTNSHKHVAKAEAGASATVCSWTELQDLIYQNKMANF